VFSFLKITAESVIMYRPNIREVNFQKVCFGNSNFPEKKEIFQFNQLWQHNTLKLSENVMSGVTPVKTAFRIYISERKFWKVFRYMPRYIASTAK